jgi:uncharacterized protein YciI
MLIAISTYLKPLPEVDVYRDAHKKFLQSLYASGKLIASGRQNPPIGGVIITKIKSVEEFKQILSDDPFCKAGVTEYKVIDFTPTLFDPIYSCLNS